RSSVAYHQNGGNLAVVPLSADLRRGIANVCLTDLTRRAAAPLACRYLVPRRYHMRTGRPTATKQIHFYAVKEDLLPVLEALESDGGAKYVLRKGQSADPRLVVFDHGKDIPSLGEATADTGNFSETFLVCKPELQIVPRSVTVFGQARFFID